MRCSLEQELESRVLILVIRFEGARLIVVGIPASTAGEEQSSFRLSTFRLDGFELIEPSHWNLESSFLRVPVQHR